MPAHSHSHPTDGDGEGDFVSVDLAPEVVGSGVQVGDGFVLTRTMDGGDGDPSYSFAEFQRTTPIVVLALAFVVVVGLVARLRGLAALVGLGFAFFVLLQFILPGILGSGSPTLVTLVGSSAIMFVVLYLAHGFTTRTTTALISTLFGLVLVAVMGAVAVSSARLLGFSGDVTITHHIASTICTIVFAYAGAALPLLLLIEIYDRPVGVVLTGTEIGEEVIRTLRGAIALILAVPVTTAVGAFFAKAAGTEQAPALLTRFAR